jgi:hypothetical protein
MSPVTGFITMGSEQDKGEEAITSDRLMLDFRKRAFRPDEGLGKDLPTKRKLPPAPGRVPVEPSVPSEEVLNPHQKSKP